MEGKIKWYDSTKGYGFIQKQENEIVEDVFFCRKDVLDLDDPSNFEKGTCVVFNVIETYKGKHAINVLRSDINYLKESRRLF